MRKMSLIMCTGQCICEHDRSIWFDIYAQKHIMVRRTHLYWGSHEIRNIATILARHTNPPHLCIDMIEKVTEAYENFKLN